MWLLLPTFFTGFPQSHWESWQERSEVATVYLPPQAFLCLYEPHSLCLLAPISVLPLLHSLTHSLSLTPHLLSPASLSSQHTPCALFPAHVPHAPPHALSLASPSLCFGTIPTHIQPAPGILKPPSSHDIAVFLTWNSLFFPFKDLRVLRL